MKLTKVFEELRKIMYPYSLKLVCQADEEGNLYIDTAHIMKNKKPLFFGAVQVKKKYVSYYLMPIYVNSGLLDSISLKLRQHLRGKSCFNFTKVDQSLFSELSMLTNTGYEYYRDEGYA